MATVVQSSSRFVTPESSPEDLWAEIERLRTMVSYQEARADKAEAVARTNYSRAEMYKSLWLNEDE